MKEGEMTNEFQVSDRVEIFVEREWRAATVIDPGSAPQHMRRASAADARATTIYMMDVPPDGWPERHQNCIRGDQDPRAVRRLGERSPHLVAAPPLVPVTITKSSDLTCPKCHGTLRARGEVRVHVGLCGCAISPTVEAVVLKAFADCDPPMVERGWRATGHGAAAVHPTEAGAIAAWRTTLERVQRDQDEYAFETVIFEARDDDSANREGVSIEFAPIVTNWSRPVIGKVATAKARRVLDVRPMVFAAEAGATDPPPALARAVRVTMEGRLFENERAALATLPTRTDAEVRTLVAALTERTHIETIVAVANECARRWPGRVTAAVDRPHWRNDGWRFDLDDDEIVRMRDDSPGCAFIWPDTNNRAAPLHVVAQRTAGVA